MPLYRRKHLHNINFRQLHGLLHYLFKQCLIAVNNIIHNITVANCSKMFSCTMYFRFLNHTELHRGHRAFCFSNKIDVLDNPLIERNRPVFFVSIFVLNVDNILKICYNASVTQLHIFLSIGKLYLCKKVFLSFAYTYR